MRIESGSTAVVADVDERLGARFSVWSPWRREGRLGPCDVYAGSAAIALTMSPAQVRAWLRGRDRALARSPSCDLLAPLLAHDETCIVVQASAARRDPVTALSEGDPVSVQGTRRALLAQLDPDRRLDRALGRLGLPRGRVDRYLNTEVSFEAHGLAVGLGGLGAGWWRELRGRPVALRWDRVRRAGWRELELAALGHEGQGEAFDLCRLAVALREAILSGEPRAAIEVAAPIVRGPGEPARVQVWIEGPPQIVGLWESDGAQVSARRARWLLGNVHGLSIAAQPVVVRTQPPIRAGRRAARREPRPVRQRRLFSLFERGIRVDDEGLVGLTPERLARRFVCGMSGVVIDGTCGVGGLTIALAASPSVRRVIAVEIDRGRLRMVRHNAGIYGVADKIEFVSGDVLRTLATRDADALVLDPPWGGRGYDRARVGLEDLGLPVGEALRAFVGPVRLKLPRSFDLETLPGRWESELFLDEREVPKFLVASRRG